MQEGNLTEAISTLESCLDAAALCDREAQVRGYISKMKQMAGQGTP